MATMTALPKLPGANAITTLSSKGQLILPKAVRDRRKLATGAKFLVEETEDGILLRPVPSIRQTTMAEVAGMLKYDGPTKTIEEMNEGVLAEARRQFARD
jgi:AbrB family looped-hinge helix DNA binding protein